MNPNPSAGRWLKSLRPQQGIEQVAQQAGSDERGERIIEGHFRSPQKRSGKENATDLMHSDRLVAARYAYVFEVRVAATL